MPYADAFLDKAPFLSDDYPFFSWDDFPQSRDSLVRGTPVILFESACWDAMVGKMEDIWEGIGYGWPWAPYFQEDQKKIFTARMYDNMCSSFWMVLPIPGYEYENYFYTERAEKGDHLTVKHMLYVADYLNKIIKYAKGIDRFAKIRTKQIERTGFDIVVNKLPPMPITSQKFGENICKTSANIDLPVLLSVLIGTKHIGQTKSMISVVNRNSVVGESWLYGKTHFHVVPDKLKSVPMASSVYGRSLNRAEILMTTKTEFAAGSISKSILNASFETPVILPALADLETFSSSQISAIIKQADHAGIDSSNWSSVSIASDAVPSLSVDLFPSSGHSTYSIEISGMESMEFGRIAHSGRSLMHSELIVHTAEIFSTDKISRSYTNTEADAIPSVSAESDLLVSSKQESNVITKTARPTWAEVVSHGSGFADVDVLDSVTAGTGINSESQQTCAMELVEAADVGANTLAFGSTTCEAAIWLLPLQPDSKTLHIRQTYKEAIKIDDMLYIDQWPDQGLTDDGTLFLWKLYDTVLHVGNTLYIGSMPDTGMMDGRTLLIWDVEQEPVKTMNLLEVF